MDSGRIASDVPPDRVAFLESAFLPGRFSTLDQEFAKYDKPEFLTDWKFQACGFTVFGVEKILSGFWKRKNIGDVFRDLVGEESRIKESGALDFLG